MTRILITSALPYINGVKHLGTLVGSMLSADIFARFKRAQGNETLFICATDEHGTPTELAALEAGKNVRAFCDELYLTQKKNFEDFKVEVEEYIDHGEDVVVALHQRASGKHSGAPVDIHIAQVWTLRDGKAVRWRIYRTKEEALAAVRP